VLTYAMFPGVAPGFFEHRAEGPKNVGKSAEQLADEAESRRSRSCRQGPDQVQGLPRWSRSQRPSASKGHDSHGQEATMQEQADSSSRARAEERSAAARPGCRSSTTRASLTARERIDALLDPDTFQETGLFRRNRTVTFGMDKANMPADGVVTGTGAVLGRPVHVASQDFTVVGGSAGETHSKKVVEMMESALKCGTPFVFINDSGGARVQEGIDSLSGYGKVFYANVKLSGAVPADLDHRRPLRRWRGLQPGADRLHHPDPQGPHVHHGPERHQAGHR
jgi:hypothetical protein